MPWAVGRHGQQPLGIPAGAPLGVVAELPEDIEVAEAVGDRPGDMARATVRIPRAEPLGPLEVAVGLTENDAPRSEKEEQQRCRS
ncbi:MAG: hypothetical protein IKP21_01230 [Bacteroidales bacterium]|nr:hypothetical protein [Bacteroidales bacterium]